MEAMGDELALLWGFAQDTVFLREVGEARWVRELHDTL
jgi:hypothetical protein